MRGRAPGGRVSCYLLVVFRRRDCPAPSGRRSTGGDRGVAVGSHAQGAFRSRFLKLHAVGLYTATPLHVPCRGSMGGTSMHNMFGSDIVHSRAGIASDVVFVDLCCPRRDDHMGGAPRSTVAVVAVCWRAVQARSSAPSPPPAPRSMEEASHGNW